jgi:hypothetical protein
MWPGPEPGPRAGRASVSVTLTEARSHGERDHDSKPGRVASGSSVTTCHMTRPWAAVARTRAEPGRLGHCDRHGGTAGPGRRGTGSFNLNLKASDK